MTGCGRIILDGNSDQTAPFQAALRTRVNGHIPSPPFPGPLTSLRDLLDTSLRAFEYRVSEQTRWHSYTSGGSVLHDYLRLVEHCAIDDLHPRRDRAFATRYLQSMSATVIRHARQNYSLIIYCGGPPDSHLETLAAAAHLPAFRLATPVDQAAIATHVDALFERLQ